MINVLLGAVIGGSVTFLIAAMLIAGARQQIIINKGSTVKYKNKKGIVYTATVHQNVRINDGLVILVNDRLPMPFVVDIDNLLSN